MVRTAHCPCLAVPRHLERTRVRYKSAVVNLGSFGWDRTMTNSVSRHSLLAGAAIAAATSFTVKTSAADNRSKIHQRKKSSTLWNERRAGLYKCKGCNLGVYDSEYKVPLTKGWVFFLHSGSHLGHVLYVDRKSFTASMANP